MTSIAALVSDPFLLAGGLALLLAAVTALVCRARARALRHFEERFRVLWDASEDGLVVVGEEGRIVASNPVATAVLGRGWPGERIDDLPGDPERWRSLVESAGQESDRVFEIETGSPSGRSVLTARARPVIFDRRRRVLVVLSDVTARRATEETLRKSEQRFRLLMGQMPALLWTTDRDLRLTSVTGAALPEGGFGAGRLVGATLEEVLGGPSHPAIAAHRRAVEGESLSYEADCSGRTYESQVEPFRDHAGEITGVIGVAIDVTQRRRTEKELEEQTAYFTQLFREAPEAIVLLNEEDRILRTNREFTRMFGYTEEEVLGKRINELIVPEDLADEASSLSRRISTGGGEVNVETVRRRKDGSPIAVSILGTPIELKDGRHIYGIYRDITEKKELESQLVRSQKMEAVGRLAGGIAHDFNNLLTAILGHARLLRDEIEGERPREELLEIERSARRAAELTRQLLAFSRRDAGQPRVLDLNEIVGEMEKLLRRLIGEDIEVVTELDRSLWPIEADPVQIEQVIMNLAVNARDAMPTGGRLRIATRNVEPNGHGRPFRGLPPQIMLLVEDNGVGMTAEQRARMFEPFYTTKALGKGTGLGLSTVYGIVDLMQGRIAVESEPGQGTAIRIFLPAVELRADGPRAAPSTPDASVGSETILLVEDEPSVRRLAQRALEARGYHVMPAGSGEEALAVLESSERPIDLLLSDVVMPGMNGYELGSRIREIVPMIRTLFMSGYSDSGVADGDGGAFLPKPFSPDVLAGKVREVLGAPVPTG